ncbi:YTH domain-containing family protein 1 isoform X2 [Morus notabilis]|uniref:YTH domain-containing family protein 1 isoform X2 n=1 Tax=Morus notabilis TaxID=981085 RepID=UPI000CED2950|nr:YTH domain-containing family protein 1 isoform X2 [Morus notabilis]
MAASEFQSEQQKQKQIQKKEGCMQLQVDNYSSTLLGHSTSSTATDSIAPVQENHDNHNHSQSSPYPTTTAAYSYYYPGYNGDFYNQGYYIAGNAVDPQYPVLQADGGSLVYLMPGFYTGYDAYPPPFNTIGVDGQYVGQQVFPLSPVFQSPIPSPEFSATSIPHGDLVQTPYLWGSSLVVGDGSFENGYVGALEIPASKPNISSGSITPSLKPVDVFSGHNKKLKPLNKASSPVSTFQPDLPTQGYYAVAKFPICSQPVNLKANVKGWGGTEKTKTTSKVNSVKEVDVHDEKDDGSRTINAKGALRSGGNAGESLAADEVRHSTSITSSIRKDQYNLPEFSTKYDHAFFFVIKSYSEDDVHKSIKYNVWTSTPNGNKKLNSAYQDAQERMTEKGSKCPVFLFFSVNASGQFCGVAEMTGQVDFNTSMDFWQQSKWNGYFPVKWHIIKDVPNAQLRHIILENNENKPVTNSRDTQEVKFDQGIKMMSIFKNYISSTCLLDDFDFYENRQKIMQEKRIRQSFPRRRDLQKVDEITAGFQSVDLSNVKNT